MSLVEFIGFLVSLIALFYAFFKKGYDEYKRNQDPEKYENERKAAEADFKRFLKTMDIKLEDEVEVPLPPKKIADKLKNHQTKHLKHKPIPQPSEVFEFKEINELQIDQQNPARIHALATKFNLPRDMILLSEILGPPKGLR